MAANQQYRDDVLATIHESVEGLYKIGIVDKKTMREFYELALTPIEPLSPEEITALREREMVSQSVFARHLNVTSGLVSKWERGEKKPAGPSLKLLTLVKKKGLDAIRQVEIQIDD